MDFKMENGRTVLVLKSGEEIIATISRFLDEQDSRGGFIYGIGAGKDFVIGYYDVVNKVYIKKTIKEEHEIISLMGDIAWLDGKPFPHCHISISDRNMNLKGGHLFEGYVTATLELIIIELEEKLERKSVPGAEIKLIQL